MIPPPISATFQAPSDARWRARISIGGIATLVFLELVAVVAFLRLLPDLTTFVRTGTVSDATREAVEVIQALLGVMAPVGSVVQLVTAIAFLAWIRKSTSNLPALAGGPGRFGTVACVGWWFVPVANLVQGYRIVADLWRRMALSERDARAWPVLTWWILWIGSWAAGVGISMAGPPTDAESAARGLAIASVVVLVNMFSGVLIASIIWTVERWARARASRLIGAVPALAPYGWPDHASAAIRVAPLAPGPQWRPAPGRPCPRCGDPQPVGSRYCSGCGFALAELV